MGRGFVRGGAETDPKDVAWCRRRGLKREKQSIRRVDTAVLDEINYAIGYGVLDDPADAPAEMLLNRPEMVHVILTGRNAHSSVVAYRRHRNRDARR